VEESGQGDLKVTTDVGLSFVAVPGDGQRLTPGTPVEIFVRPEAISVHRADRGDSASAAAGNRQGGIVDSLLFNGANSRVLVRTQAGQLIEADCPQVGEIAELKPGDAVDLTWSMVHTTCFPRAET
jgi:spermidine/putrescine transport system ATP-binding protein